jgi:uncharacterized membrane protein YfcA
MLTTGITIAIVCLAFFGQSIFGFAGSPVAISLLGLILPVKEAVNIVLIFQTLMGVMLTKVYQEVDWQLAKRIAIGLIPGAIVGIFLFSVVDSDFLKKVLGIFMILFVAKAIFLEKISFGTRHCNWAFAVGFIGGCLQGIVGTASPILAPYLVTATRSKNSFRATLIFLFFAASSVRLIGSLATRLVELSTFKLTLPIIPFFLAAIFVGGLVHKRFNDTVYRYSVYSILLLSGIAMLRG